MRRTNLTFDEVNSLSREYYEEYFGEIKALDKDQIEDRVLLAMALEDRFLDVLSLIEVRKNANEPYLSDAIDMFTMAFLAVALRRIDDDHIRDTASQFGIDVALSTYRHPDEDYMTSIDRAINMAATESNAIMCYGELADAVKEGKTMKCWNTIIDGHEREWHHEVNQTVVPITEPFEVGGELRMYPLDTSLGASADNITNCRCTATYY